MDIENIQITDKQAHQFAFGIYLDIAHYIKEHQEEYKKWLKKKEGNNE